MNYDQGSKWAKVTIPQKCFLRQYWFIEKEVWQKRYRDDASKKSNNTWSKQKWRFFYVSQEPHGSTFTLPFCPWDTNSICTIRIWNTVLRTYFMFNFPTFVFFVDVAVTIMNFYFWITLQKSHHSSPVEYLKNKIWVIFNMPKHIKT